MYEFVLGLLIIFSIMSNIILVCLILNSLNNLNTLNKNKELLIIDFKKESIEYINNYELDLFLTKNYDSKLHQISDFFFIFF